MSKRAKKTNAIIFTVVAAVCFSYGISSLFLKEPQLLYQCSIFFGSGSVGVVLAVIFWIKYSKAEPDKTVQKLSTKHRIGSSKPSIDNEEEEEPKEDAEDKEWEEMEEEEEESEFVEELFRKDD